MTEYDNTNTGVLFKNDKGDNPARPEYTGEIDVEGKKYRLAAWIRESKTSGKKFLSLRVSDLTVLDKPAEVKEDDPDNQIPF